MDRAGLVGSDGAVHHGFADIAFLRLLPHMTLMAPADAAELTAALEFAFSQAAPCAIRYPRDEVSQELPGDCPPFELGRSRTIREGADGTFLCYGAMVEQAMDAAETLAGEGVHVAVVNARFAKPLDTAAIARLLAGGKPLVTVEDHSVAGGFGSAVAELAASRGLAAANLRILGIPDRYISHASRQQQLTECGLDVPALAATMKDLVRNPAVNAAKRYL
jgi:1-deoxy-D-xylulose-5-phosphate synthase